MKLGFKIKNLTQPETIQSTSKTVKGVTRYTA